MYSGETVFICYSRDDTEFVFDLTEALLNRYRSVLIWFDRIKIREGEDWDRAIDEALYACPFFIIVLSPASVASNEVRAELRVALDENKHIIPVLYEPCNVPRQLRLRQTIDMTQPGMNIAYAASKVEDIVYGDDTFHEDEEYDEDDY
jgi:hypothetical protein